MKDPEEKNQSIKKGEDEISAAQSDVNATEKRTDEGFKTGGGGEKLEWKVPQDEQMFENRSPDAENDRTEAPE